MPLLTSSRATPVQRKHLLAFHRLKNLKDVVNMLVYENLKGFSVRVIGEEICLFYAGDDARITDFIGKFGVSGCRAKTGWIIACLKQPYAPKIRFAQAPTASYISLDICQPPDFMEVRVFENETGDDKNIIAYRNGEKWIFQNSKPFEVKGWNFYA